MFKYTKEVLGEMKNEFRVSKETSELNIAVVIFMPFVLVGCFFYDLFLMVWPKK